jgi:thiamine kinase-like enzyme
VKALIQTRACVLTWEVRYLLINYHLAELIQRISSPDRKQVIQRARDAYERYLSLLDHYQVLSSPDQKLYNTYTESPTTFSTVSTTDPDKRRDAKIANFKLEKELKKKMEVGYCILQQSVERGSNHGAVPSKQPRLPRERR